MNPDSSIDPTESSLTALLLGELPHDQAAALHQKLAQDPELAKLYERLKHTINLVRETITSPAAQTAGQPTPLRLSDQRRQKLLQHFKTVATKEFAPPRWRPVRWLIPVGIAAALVVILGALLLPALSRSKSRGSSLAFNTWSLSRKAEPAALAPAAEKPFRYFLDLNRNIEFNRNGRAQGPAAPGEGRLSGLPVTPPAPVPSEPAKHSVTAIVLPQGSEMADATTTPLVREGVNTWTASAANRGLYYDSSGRAGGTGSGGSSGGGTRGDAPPAQHDFASRPAYAPIAPETVNSTVEAPPPAVVPPPIAMGAPAENSPGKDTILNSTAPTLAPTEATPADSPATPRVVLQGITSFLGTERPIMKVLPAAPSASAAAEALPSPKDDGVAGGSGGAAAALAPFGPQEVAVTRKLAFRQAERVPSPQKLAEARPSAQGGTTPSDTDKLSKEAVGQVPGVPAQEVNLADKLVEINQDDRKALGFDWYRGNSLENKGAIKAQGGTAPPEQAGKSAGTAGFNVAAAGTENSSSYLYFDSAAQPGQATSDGDKVPILGDVPAVGRLYRIRPGAAVGGGVNANLGAPASPQDVAWGAVQAGVVANNYLGVATNYQTADMFGLAQAPTTPSSSTTNSGYVDTSAQWNFGTGNANGGWLGRTHPNNTTTWDATFSTDPETRRTVPIDYAKAADISHALTNLAAANERRESVGVFDLQNGAPADVYASLQDLFQRNNAPRDGQPIQEHNLARRSTIALPTAQGETSLALKDSEKRQLGFVAGGTGKALNELQNVDSGASGESANPLMSADKLRKLEGSRIEAKAELVRNETLLRRLKELGKEQGTEKLAQALPSAAPDSQLSAKVASEKERLANLEAELDRAQKQDAEAAAKTRPYFEAKRSLEELQRFRQILDGKIAYEKIDVDLPKTPMVEIVDKAVPEPTQGPTLGERLRSALGGKVERSARVKVERDQSDIAGLADRQPAPGYDPYLVQTEFEAIQSEAILGKVAEDLKLKEAWAEKKGADHKLTTAETVQLLKQSLDLRPVPNTSLLEIGVKSDKPEEAAKIANAVAEAYKARRLEQRAQLSKAGTKALEERYAQQTAKVIEAQKKVDDLRVKLNIPDAVAAGQAPATDVGTRKPTAPTPIPQPEVQTAENAFSTFSLNVSDVSFKLAAASLEKGVMPEPATVRSEEFINAFDYRDPEPPPGVPVAFAWERAQYPFAQNRDLLRFSIKTAAQGRQPGRPLNLVLLLDNSGSMERADRVRIIREALRVLAGQLQPQDKLSVITFARTPRLFADGAPGSDAEAVVMALTELTPQGGTNLEDAMNLAYQTALRHYLANGVNRVVLLTDGAANLGNVDPEALKQKVEANRKQGVALDCFGIGWEGYNDDLLEVLSRNGDGRYAFLNTPEEVADEFAAKLAGALQVAASDVKVQVEFNPARVTAYRQIGYAKHQLTKEQFRDNTVNAAQIGAAEAGNALYTVEVNPNGTGPLCTVRVRFRIPGTADYREHAWDVPFNGNAVALEQASPAMRLAATASALSEWLASSPCAAEVTPDRLLSYVRGVPEVYGADARPKKLEWMIRQAKSIAGK